MSSDLQVKGRGILFRSPMIVKKYMRGAMRGRPELFFSGTSM